MKYKMVVSDLYATLLRTNKTISEENIDAIRRACKKGVIFVIATGRILRSASVYADILGINSPVAACNGAVLVDSNKNILLDEYLSLSIKYYSLLLGHFSS